MSARALGVCACRIVNHTLFLLCVEDGHCTYLLYDDDDDDDDGDGGDGGGGGDDDDDS